MARVRLLKPHFLGTVYREAGSVIEWDGPLSQEMEPADAPLFNPLQPVPGLPRVAGPPGQAVAPAATSSTAVRLVETAELQKDFEQKRGEQIAAEEARLAEARTAADESSPRDRRRREATAPKDTSLVEAKADADATKKPRRTARAKKAAA